MKMELLRAKDLTNEERNALKRLSFRSNGQLMYCLDDFGDDPSTRVIRITKDGRILSWGLVYKNRYYYDKSGARLSEPIFDGRWDYQCYTRTSERRKGLASKIYSKAVQVSHGRANMIVHPHSDSSDAYFDKLHFDETGKVRQSKKKKSNSKRKVTN